MQPYFLPYLGYIALIAEVDRFILFDTPQYIRHGWINRNQILNHQNTPVYIQVPLVKHKRETPINQVVIRNSDAWQQKILAQLNVYKRRAPFFDEVTHILEATLQEQTDSIVELNYRLLREICSYLEINTPIEIFSEMNLELGQVNAPDEWALEICKAIKANHYINPIGGMTFFDSEKYRKENISIEFLEFIPTAYNQLNDDFVPNLSVIDAMMFNNKEVIRKQLKSIKLHKNS